jgi:hypothetical protein
MWHNLTKGDAELIKIALKDKGGAPFERIARELDDAIAEQEGPVATAYREAAFKRSKDGELEVDAGAVVSMGDDPGAYVAAWLWIPKEDAVKEAE